MAGRALKERLLYTNIRSFKRCLGRPLREKISMHIFSLKGFPIVPMNIHRDTCIAEPLNDIFRFETESFFEGSESSSDPVGAGERLSKGSGREESKY